MKKVIVVTDDPDGLNPLSDRIRLLFPECEILIKSIHAEDFDKEAHHLPSHTDHSK